MKHKVCYIISEYNDKDSFLSEASKELDIFLLAEKGMLPEETFGCSDIKLIGSSFFLVRALKLNFWVLYARYHGYCDFYVHQSFLAALTASVAVRLCKGRVFYWNCGEPWKYKHSFFYKTFERLLYRLTTFVVTGTQKLANEYAEHYQIPMEKIKVIPKWTDTEKFKEASDKNAIRKELGLPLDKKIIFFANRLSLHKGSRILLPVARDLLQIRQDLFFVVVGEGEDKKKLSARSQVSDVLRRSVNFLGSVSSREMQKYFSVADVFFIPSHEEGFPRVLLEAMASGVPVVASDVGSISEILPISMKPFLVRSGDVSLFVRMLNKVLSQNLQETNSKKNFAQGRRNLTQKSL